MDAVATSSRACFLDQVGSRLRTSLVAALAVMMAGPISAQSIPAELDGRPVVELTRVTDASGRAWVGTYGHGILVREGDTWRRIASDTADSSLSWDFVHAIAFGPVDQVWIGTIGNGWGLSRDDGRTWQSWTFGQLGPEWQYVAPDGIVTVGDTTIIATADGIQITTDDGRSWLALVDRMGPAATGPADTALAVLPGEYFTDLHIARGDTTFVLAPLPGCGSGAGNDRLLPLDWLTSRSRAVPGQFEVRPTMYATTLEAVMADVVPRPAGREWSPPFARPIRDCDNNHIDQTYRFGSTMGGNFQPHQGVEFNNPDGTPVLAIGDGLVSWSGPAERGALTVAIRHEPLTLDDGSIRFIYSVYYHNSTLGVQVGDSVTRGQQIAEVGHTGRATNDHLHLEVHALPVDSVGLAVDPEVRFPPHVTYPELWIEPLPGTGAIAGVVTDAGDAPVQQARIYGIRKPLPRETPFAFAESYGPRNHPSPMFGENFAISDVPAGEHRLRVEIDGKWIEQVVSVAPGRLTWVELRP